jgi:hypothetical protein
MAALERREDRLLVATERLAERAHRRREASDSACSRDIVGARPN